jgi:hypothetical protein
MRIISESENQLIVKQDNIGNILFGIIFILIGVGISILSIMAVAIGVIFFLVGIYIVFSSKSTKIILNRLSRTITVEYVGLRYKNIRNLNFDEVKGITIQQFVKEITVNTGPRSPQEINLVIFLKNGEEILINAGESNNTYIMGVQLQKGLLPLKDKNRGIAEKISNFIGVPFIDGRSKTLQEGFSNFTKQMGA